MHLKATNLVITAMRLLPEFGYDPDSDTDNTCDSVFCSKGSGYTVKWDEVKSHMHLPSILSTPKSEYAQTFSKSRVSSYADKKDLFALDKELMEIFEQTYGRLKTKIRITAISVLPKGKNA